MPDEKIEFNKAGPGGPASFAAGVAGFETGAFRGMGVTRAMPFETSDESDAVQMLQRQTQIGEYYIIGAPDNCPPADKFCSWDTIIFNEDTDTLERIRFVDVLDHLRAMFGTAGADGLLLLCKLLGATRFSNPAEAAANQYNVGDSGELHSKAAKAAFDAQQTAYTARAVVTGVGTFVWDSVDGDAILNAIRTHAEKGQWLPFKIVLARPFIEHLSLSAIVAVAGTDTGATLFGPSDMQLSANTSVKTIEGCAAPQRAPGPRSIILGPSGPRRRCAVPPRLACGLDTSHCAAPAGTTRCTPRPS